MRVKKLWEELKAVLEENQIWKDEPMKRHTTFQTGGPADWYLTPRAEQLVPLFAMLKQRKEQVTIIGNGSNLLVGDGGIRGVVVEIGKAMQEISVSGNVITAQAGAVLGSVVSKACKNSLTGMEFAAGIPGTVGGAMVMNAGAYGGEMKDVVSKVKVLTPEGEILSLKASEMEFGYRKSIVAEKGYVVLEADFLLEPGKMEEIQAKMEELRRQRISKQPLEYPSAGSTFKRPEGYFAGKLIMDCGLSGFSVGGAKVSEKHCGFVINRGGSARDILAVIRHVQKKVKENYGVELETEVKLVGEFL
ncbi:MAG: UDP-N-acetylmuramate dehydrogenase [Roseburia sp.]|nr:UDP-N-acetylmuramate dehydrogenase [Roseburia sp.]